MKAAATQRFVSLSLDSSAAMHVSSHFDSTANAMYMVSAITVESITD